MRTIAIIGAAAIVGCAYEDARPAVHAEGIVAVVSRRLHGDKRCSDRTQRAFDAACIAYANITDGRARLSVAWDLDDASLMRFATEPVVVCVDTLPPNVGAETDGDVIKFATLVCTDEYACALHELGHYLGMQHLAHGHGVMSATNPARSFSPGDLAELFRVGLYARPRTKDVTTVTVDIDPAIPRVEPDYPKEN